RRSDERLSMRSPSSMMRPWSGLSSVPSRCKSVLLPDPELPTMPRNSPARAARSTPLSTSVTTACLRYVLNSPAAASSGDGSDMEQAPEFEPQRHRGQKKGGKRVVGWVEPSRPTTPRPVGLEDSTHPTLCFLSSLCPLCLCG